MSQPPVVSQAFSNQTLANCEIIAVGSELLTPDRLDTNSLYLTEQLNGIGVEVRRKSIIGDDRARLAAEVHAALLNSEIVILTGGLGPTEDDVTRDSVAAALGRQLIFRHDLLDQLMERFKRLNRKMADNNRRQTFLVEGAEPLPNPRGTAPGQWIEVGKGTDGRLVILLPGPPHELKAMFAAECMPRLARRLPPQAIGTRFYRISCMGESDLDQLISPVYKPFENPVTTVLAGLGDIQVHLRARATTAEEAERLLQQVAPRIEQLLGDRIYSRDGSPLEAVVGTMLRERSATVSVAESCTGGMLGERLTSVAGSSDYFLGGFLVYAERLKTELLGIDPALIAQHSLVSEPVAETMALQARARTGSTYAVSITGEAGPESATKAPVGTVVVGIAGPDGGATARSYNLFGDRNGIRARAATWALDDLRRAISGHPRSSTEGVQVSSASSDEPRVATSTALPKTGASTTNLLRERALRALGTLPPFSPVLNRLLASLASEDVSFTKLADLIEKDTIVSANLLHLVNSAMYARRGTVNSVRHALSLLGVNKLRNAVLGMSIARMWNSVRTPPGWSMANFNMHSVATAQLSDMLAQKVPVSYPEGAFIAGLLHDVGLLLIAVGLPSESAQILERSQKEGCSLAEAESDLLGFTHADLSAAALASWNLPAPIQEAVRDHHLDVPCAPGSELPLATLVNAADRYVDSAGICIHLPPVAPIADPAILAPLGLGAELQRKLLEEFDAEFAAMKPFFR